MVVQAEHSIPTGLRRQWSIFAAVSLAGLAAGFILLAGWQASAALRWLGLAALATLYLWRELWRGLPLNHRPGEARLLPGLGAGNAVSLLRGALLAGLAGFSLLPQPPGGLAWLPGILYTTAILADFCDGYLARRTNHITSLGERLDLSLDGLGMLSAAWLAVWYGQAPVFYIAVALARPAFVAGLWLRRRLGLPIFELPPSHTRRALAGVQMGLAAALLMPAFSPPGTYLAATLFAIPFLTGFLNDWFAVSGVFRQARSAARPAKLAAARARLPLALRLGVALVWLPQVWAGQPQEPLAQALTVSVVVLLAAGAAGRVVAVVGLLLLGVQQGAAGLDFNAAALVCLYTAILYLGTGPFSLWKPEERWITERAGSPAASKASSIREAQS